MKFLAMHITMQKLNFDATYDWFCANIFSVNIKTGLLKQISHMLMFRWNSCSVYVLKWDLVSKEKKRRILRLVPFTCNMISSQ